MAATASPWPATAAPLYFLASHLNLEGTEAAGWKLEVVASEVVRVE